MTDDASCKRRPKWLGLPFIATIAKLAADEQMRMLEYVRAENKVYKELFKGRVPFTDDHRRLLVNTATAMSTKLMRTVVGIVKPETILAWQRRLEKKKWDYAKKRKAKPGRPRLPGEVEALVCRLARENVWGYKRIQGELEKLGTDISDTTVANMLRRNGLPPAPDRKGMSWRDFLSRHADVLLCGDLLTKEIWTIKGLQTAFVFFVIHLRTRRVLLSQATFSPTREWVKQQMRQVTWVCEESGIKPRFFLCDNDGSYGDDFNSWMKGMGIEVLRIPRRAPNANSVGERWVRSLRKEVLDHLILFGLDRLQHVLDQYRDFFNAHRPHQGIENRIPNQSAQSPDAPALPTSKTASPPGSIQCRQFLGGLLKSYFRRAA